MRGAGRGAGLRLSARPDRAIHGSGIESIAGSTCPHKRTHTRWINLSFSCHHYLAYSRYLRPRRLRTDAVHVPRSGLLLPATQAPPGEEKTIKEVGRQEA